MAGAYFVNIWKTQGDGDITTFEVLLDLIYLAANVPAGPANKRQKVALNLPG